MKILILPNKIGEESMLPKIMPRKTTDDGWQEARRELLQKEAEIGGTLFGQVPKGHHRQFFCLDDHTWVWYEEWLDQNGQRKVLTTRYEIRPDGILKVQDGQAYQELSREETRNLYQAALAYHRKVTDYYNQLLIQGA